MPKVPVYQSQATPTTDTGMVSYTRAQKDSRPYIQAALAEGETASTAATLISNFMDKRIRSEGDLAADIALAGADAALESEVSRLSRVTDPTSVFNDDLTGPNNWMGNVNDIRDASTSGLNTYAQKRFNTKFAAKAAQHRSKLRVEIDKRVVASRLALFDTELENLTLSFGNINDFKSHENETKMLSNYANAQFEILNTGRQLVAEGLLAQDDLQTKLNKSHTTIAETAMSLFFNEQKNPVAAFKQFKAGGKKARNLARNHPNAGFGMHMLATMPNQQEKLELLEKLEDAAYNAADREDKEKAARDKADKKKLTKIRNSLFERGMSPAERTKRIKILEAADFLTAADQNAIEDLKINGDAVFRATDQGDEGNAVVDLQELKTAGRLVPADVEGRKNKLTQATYMKYMDAAGSLIKEQRGDIINVARDKFKYFGNIGDPIDDYEKASRAAFYNVSAQLDEFEVEFRKDNGGRNPTNAVLRLQVQKLIKAEKQNLDNLVIIQLTKIMNFYDKKILGGETSPIPKMPRGADGKYDIGSAISHLTQVAIDHEEKAEAITRQLPKLRYYIDLLGER
jgi:hypothetical protein